MFSFHMGVILRHRPGLSGQLRGSPAYLSLKRTQNSLTCGAHHVLPLDHIGVPLMELPDALFGKPAVVKFKDMPDIHRDAGDLKLPPVVPFHQAVATANIHPVQYSAACRLGHRHHQRHIIWLDFCPWLFLQGNGKMSVGLPLLHSHFIVNRTAYEDSFHDLSRHLIAFKKRLYLGERLQQAWIFIHHSEWGDHKP